MFKEEFCQIKNLRLTFFPQYFVSTYWFLVGGADMTALLFKASSVWWLTSPLLCSQFSLLPFESLIITCSGTSFSELILPRVHLMSLMYRLADFVECGHYLSSYCFLPFFPFWESYHMPASQVPAVLTFLSLFLLSVPRLCISVFHLQFTGCFLC